MSEREFLELLNLYLDREITPEDADRLEREIRSDASRHRTYLQYCRMQQAVRLLGSADDLGSEMQHGAGRGSALRKAGGGWGSQWIWTGALAAAAIVIVTVLVRRPEATKANEATLAAAKAPLEPGAGAKPAALGLSGDALLLSAFPAANSAPKVHEDQFNWMRQFRLVSLETRTGAPSLAPSASNPQPTVPATSNRPSGEDATEMAAFKFVK